MNIIKLDEHYVVMKQYSDGTYTYARPIAKFKDLREAVKLSEEFASAVPANSVGGGGVSGLDIGYSKKKKYKFFDKGMMRRRKPKVV